MPCVDLLAFRREKVTSIPKQYTWFSECEIAIGKNVNCSVKNFRQTKKLSRGPEGGLGLD